MSDKKLHKSPYEVNLADFSDSQQKLFDVMLAENEKAKKEKSPHIKDALTAKNAFSRIVYYLGESGKSSVDELLAELTNTKYEEHLRDFVTDQGETRIGELLSMSLMYCGRKKWREVWNSVRAINSYITKEYNFCYVAEFAPTNLISRTVNLDIENETELQSGSDGAVVTVKTKRKKYLYWHDLQNLREGDSILRVSTVKLMDYMFAIYAETRNPNISFTVEQYLTDQGRPVTRANRNDCREDIKRDCETLLKQQLAWYESVKEIGKDGKEHSFMRLIEYVGLNGGHLKTDRGPIEWTWSPFILSRMKTAAAFHRDIFKIDTRSDAYLMARCIELNYRMNLGKTKDFSIISIDTLLKEARNLPSVEDMRADSKAGYHRRLIMPFFRNLDQISYLFYEVYKANGDHVKDYSELSLDDFEAGQIVVNYDNYPEDEKRIEKYLKNVQKRAEQKEERKAKESSKEAQ